LTRPSCRKEAINPARSARVRAKKSQLAAKAATPRQPAAAKKSATFLMPID
jgi:hypothetical protein